MFRLVQTSSGCPEQYDVYQGRQNVGYLSLRNGWFTAKYLGYFVYQAKTESDGVFSEEERDYQLTQACKAILKEIEGPLYEIVQESDL